MVLLVDKLTKKDFLNELADLCEKYNACIDSDRDTGGVEIKVDYKRVFLGFLFDDDAYELLREVAKKCQS